MLHGNVTSIQISVNARQSPQKLERNLKQQKYAPKEGY